MDTARKGARAPNIFNSVKARRYRVFHPGAQLEVFVDDLDAAKTLVLMADGSRLEDRKFGTVWDPATDKFALPGLDPSTTASLIYAESVSRAVLGRSLAGGDAR